MNEVVAFRTAHHPIWGILRVAILGLVLYLTASDFDETEIITLLLFGSGESGVEFLQRRAG